MDDIEFEREVLFRQFEKVKLSRGECWDELRYLFYENNDDEERLNRYIESSLRYINKEYEKGKYGGRDMLSLFGGIFRLIGEEAHSKFMAANDVS